jgi:formylglycine-generating enzyme required for sulfatase activity
MDPGLADQPMERDARLLRGGSWVHNPRYCRSAFRSGSHPDDRYDFWGFRVCCLPQDLLLYS